MVKERYFLSAVLTLAVTSFCVWAERVAADQPKKVIFETDMCLDVDDVGALATLHAMADIGETDILAVCFNEVHPSGAAAIDAINTWYGRGEIPVGIYKGHLDNPDESKYLTHVADFPHDLTNETAPNALDVYLKILREQPDNSVTIISVGFLNNLSDLLKTDPDLVAQKVAKLVIMGGVVNDNFNLVRHNLVEKTEYVIRNWPTPVVISQHGGAIRTGARLSDAPAANPVREAYYRWFNEEFKGRSSWDQIAVLYGVRGLGKYFSEATNRTGRLRNGYEWQMKPGSRSYLNAQLSDNELADIVEDLMIKRPARVDDADRIRIILDTDANNELDDQHAIAYMLFNGDKFAVEGITVNRTSGGGGINKHVEEAERVVGLCASQSRVKVYQGASGNYEEILPHIGELEHDGSEAVDFIIERAKADDTRKLVLMPIGKLTNIALALKKAPSIAKKVRIVWLGTNYPQAGEYNFDNDIPALDPILDSQAAFEMVMVRYGKPSGTDAVKARLEDIRRIMPGKGPLISTPVNGRHGGVFSNFGDYSIELFEKFPGGPTARPLFDMAAVAIVKNPAWAKRVTIGAPKFVDGKWLERPRNPRKVVIWEDFDKEGILKDFYSRMDQFVLVKP